MESNDEKHLSLDKSMAEVVEQNITPLMEYAVTVPCLVDTKDIGVAVYVTVSYFLTSGLSEIEKQQLVMDVAKRLSIS